MAGGLRGVAGHRDRESRRPDSNREPAAYKAAALTACATPAARHANAVEFESLRAALSAAVPFNSTLGLVYEELSRERAVLRLPDRAELHNHVGGPHAGAMFSLGESASGGVVIANFVDLLGTATPLAASAEITYRRVAKGDVVATATLGRDRDEVLAELDETGRARFPVRITLSDAGGETTGEMTVQWHLRRDEAAGVRTGRG